MLTLNDIDNFPLARYTAEYWTYHARAATEEADQVNQLSIQLFHSERDAYINWIQLYDPDQPWEGVDITKSVKDIASPLYYASREGVVKSVACLFEEGAVCRGRHLLKRWRFWTQSTRFGACSESNMVHEEVVEGGQDLD